MTDTSGTNVRDVIAKGGAFLGGHGVDAPRLACELLLARLLRCRPLELALHYDQAVPANLLEAMRRGLRRVADGEPVQYVLGQTSFMGHVLKVDKRALIPRPETEQLVELVLACAPLWQGAEPAVADVGTGSGCIAISLALARPRVRCLAVDTSAEALALALENATLHGVIGRVTFAPTELSDVAEPAMLDAVVSNPPYIRTADWEQLPVHIRGHEPRQALDGGSDGLRVLAAVAEEAALALKPGGLLFLEIGADQGPAVRRLLEETGFVDVDIRRDLAGLNRFALGCLPLEQ